MKHILNSRGFTLIEMLVTGMILSIIVGLSFFSMSFYLNEWETGRLGDISAVEDYRKQRLVQTAVESAWEYYVTDPANQRLGNYYPYFKGTEKSAAFVTTSPVFSESRAAAARLSLDDSGKSPGIELVYEEVPLDNFYIRYYEEEIDYPYSLRLQTGKENMQLRYYGLWEIRFLPQQDDFREVLRWQDAFDGKERRAMPKTIQVADDSDEEQVFRKFDIRARNQAKAGFFSDPY